MSTYTSTQWTCDRCGYKTEVVSEQPFGWAALYYIRPPLKNPTEDDKLPDQVCPTCLDAYFDWFTAGRKDQS